MIEVAARRYLDGLLGGVSTAAHAEVTVLHGGIAGLLAFLRERTTDLVVITTPIAAFSRSSTPRKSRDHEGHWCGRL